mgnify:CR=1 FL=1
MKKMLMLNVAKEIKIPFEKHIELLMNRYLRKYIVSSVI